MVQRGYTNQNPYGPTIKSSTAKHTDASLLKCPLLISVLNAQSQANKCQWHYWQHQHLCHNLQSAWVEVVPYPPQTPLPFLPQKDPRFLLTCSSKHPMLGNLVVWWKDSTAHTQPAKLHPLKITQKLNVARVMFFLFCTKIDCTSIFSRPINSINKAPMIRNANRESSEYKKLR